MSQLRLAATRLLARFIEVEVGVVTTPLDPNTQDAMALLIRARQIRATEPLTWVRCPECYEQHAHVQDQISGNRYRGFCGSCGTVEVAAATVLQFSVQILQTLTYLATGLGLSRDDRVEVVPDRAWYLGTMIAGRKQRAWYFGRHLDQQNVTQALRQQIEADRCAPIATVITSSATDRLNETRLRDIDVVRLDTVTLLGEGRMEFDWTRMAPAIEAFEELDVNCSETTFRLVRRKGIARIDGVDLSLSPQERSILIAFFEQPEHEMTKMEMQRACGSDAQRFKPNHVFKHHPILKDMIEFRAVERVYRLRMPLTDAGIDL